VELPATRDAAQRRWWEYGPVIGKRRDLGRHRFNALDARFDFDVARHGT
jgi:hypothetical protein